MLRRLGITKSDSKEEDVTNDSKVAVSTQFESPSRRTPKKSKNICSLTVLSGEVSDIVNDMMRLNTT